MKIRVSCLILFQSFLQLIKLFIKIKLLTYSKEIQKSNLTQMKLLIHLLLQQRPQKSSQIQKIVLYNFTIVFSQQQFKINLHPNQKMLIIYFLQANLKVMKKTIGKLIIAIQGRTSGSKRSSNTIASYVNKVPCNKQDLNKPSEASIFVNQQMNDYPLPVKQKTSKRQMKLSEKIKVRLQENQQFFNQLISKLEIQLTFLEIEEMRELIQFMNEKEVSKNTTALKKLKNVVNYFLESSQQNIYIGDHILESAALLIDEIKEAQKKKVNQMV